ncbi:protein DOG1-like 3 [Euphorbia lathyris]|uniref:protein DOG1-like 3 n=1 Tax=Euphorbia lathyris TaxID=212925 RepID=UPI003313E66B
MAEDTAEKCFLDWLQIQEADLDELLQALDQAEKPDDLLNQLVEKTISHFQEYMEKRIEHARDHVCDYLSPAWNSSLENSLLWIGGCRPSIFIRLVYVLSGSQFESHLSEYIRGIKRGNLGDLSATQMVSINELHQKTIRNEEKLTSKLASLQENIADKPICIIANERREAGAGEINEEVNRALGSHEEGMLCIMGEADNFRLHTLKELISILSPLQAVEFLASGKKLHLCVHQWCKTRDVMPNATD